MNFRMDNIINRPRQRTLGLALIALILIGSMSWFRAALSPLFMNKLFGDVDVISILALLGLWVVWRLSKKAI